MMSVAQQVLLSSVEYDVLWSHLQLGRMPYPLSVPSVGFRAEERAQVVRQAWEGLTNRGLTDASGLADDVARLLRLIARPELSVDAVGHVGKPFRALAARDGSTAVVAQLTDAGLALAAIAPTSLASAVVGLLPYAEPGSGHAFTFPHNALNKAMEYEDEDIFFDGDERDALTRAGLDKADARVLAELAAGRTSGGQFGVNSWNRLRNTRFRGQTLVTWLDTDTGRYLVVREQDWISVSPAGADRIATRLDQVLAKVAGSH